MNICLQRKEKKVMNVFSPCNSVSFEAIEEILTILELAQRVESGSATIFEAAQRFRCESEVFKIFSS